MEQKNSMLNLNLDQQKSLKTILSWWKGNQLYMILDGAAGTGKTFLVNEVLHSLPNCRPMILAPTHEALKQVSEKIEGNYLLKTVHSALGITPTTDKQDLEFEHIRLPEFWSNFNLVVLDEASMLSSWLLDILKTTETKILFIGHKSQLPPVDKKRGVFDKCISPVFEQGWLTTTLTTPMRNTGSLFDYNNLLEKMIYSSNRIVPNTFDIKTSDLAIYLESDKGKDDLLNGETKVVLWSNEGVDNWNRKLRLSIFGGKSIDTKYLPTDKIILTAPLSVIPCLENHSDVGLSNIDYASDGLDKCYSNTKAEVIYCEEVEISLNENLFIPCYKIAVKCDDGCRYFYEAKDSRDIQYIDDYYKHLAWKAGSKQQKIKAFKTRRFILSCFAQIKHYYAATSYRLQGCSIPNIICINSDIAKVKNIVEAKKHRYVACSRARDNLYFYRGL